jgi:hypothetical protein
MNLKKLCKETQSLLEEGIAIIYVWKIGRSWNFEPFWAEKTDENGIDTFAAEDQKIIDEIRKTDKNTIDLNGYESFGDYSLQYIEWRIKKAYEDNKDMNISTLEEC